MLYRERRGALPVIDPAMNSVARAKAKTRAFIRRRPYEDPTAPVEPTVHVSDKRATTGVLDL